MLPRHTFDAVYAEGPDVILAGVFNPTGVATPRRGGYRVTGRWTLRQRVPARRLVPRPLLRATTAAAPGPHDAAPSRATSRSCDTWSVSGLRGTGSHDVAVDGRRSCRTSAPSSSVDPPCRRRTAAPHPGAGRCRRSSSPASPSASPTAPSTTSWRSPPARCRPSPSDPGRQPAVPAPARRGRRPAAGGPRAARTPTPRRPGRSPPAARPLTDRHRARHRGTATWVVAGRGVGRRHRLHRGRRQLDLPRQPAPAPAARHPRPDPALRRQARHLHHGRRRARRPGRRPHVPVTAAAGPPGRPASPTGPGTVPPR